MAACWRKIHLANSRATILLTISLGKGDGPKLVLITPDFNPPETLGHHLKDRIDPLIPNFSHVGIIDRDIYVPPQFFDLPAKYPDADIIGNDVRPVSLIHRAWETTYGVRLKERIRGGAIIYSTKFLWKVGGYPDTTTPDTWLEKQARFTVFSALKVLHDQPFDFKHSVHIQLRDGKSRAELNYPLWKTTLHAIFRLRPLVLYADLRERLKH